MDNLPEDIRKEIEASADWEIIMEIVERLRGNGIKITRDVLAAVKLTLEMSDSTVE
jgi:hypothetical protein